MSQVLEAAGPVKAGIKGKKGFAPAVLGSGWLWTSLRLSTLVLLGLVIAWAWGRSTIPGLQVPDPLMYTNLGNLLFWVFWLMGLVLIAPLAGRAWCGVCPLGAANEIAARFGMGKAFPSLLRNQHLKAAVLVVTVLLMGLARIHHVPSMTAWYLLAWVGGALALGAFFSGRSMCSYLCPVGGMLGLYGRTAPVALGVRDPEVCTSCEGRECVKGSARWVTGRFGRLNTMLRLRRYPCPVNLKVWDMGGSDRCLGCFNCLKACPWNNVALFFRGPLSALWRENFPRFSDTVLVSVLTGYVILAFSRFWPASETVLSAPVRWMAPLLGPAARPVFLLWLVLVLPLLSFLLAAAAARWGHQGLENPGDGGTSEAHGGFPLRFWLSGQKQEREGGQEEQVLDQGTVRGLSATCAGVVIPLLLAAHMVLALVKLNAKAGYLPLAVADPAGLASYTAAFELGTIRAPGLIFPLEVMRGGALAILALGTLASLAVYRNSVLRKGIGALAPLFPLVLLGAVVYGGLFSWLF